MKNTGRGEGEVGGLLDEENFKNRHVYVWALQEIIILQVLCADGDRDDDDDDDDDDDNDDDDYYYFCLLKIATKGTAQWHRSSVAISLLYVIIDITLHVLTKMI